MQFVNPIWLWGLTGLLVPIGIHFLSRKEGRTMKIGSVRHLEDSVTKQFKNIRLNELVLLAIRCLLITLFVLLLSGLHLNSSKENKKWLLIERGLEKDEKFTELVDTLRERGFEIRSFAAGFPDLSDSLAANQTLDYWSLVQDLQPLDIKQAVVLSYNYVYNFKGKRIQLPENVRWIFKNPETDEFTLRATQISPDSIVTKVGVTDGNQTNFLEIRSAVSDQQQLATSNFFDTVRTELPDTIFISIVYDPDFGHDKAIITAALQAVDQSISNVLSVNDYPTAKFSGDTKSGWVIWLSEKPTNNLKGNYVRYQPLSNSKNLLEQTSDSNRNNSWILTERLTEEIALRENLTVQLGLVLTQDYKLKSKLKDFDRRALPELLMWSENRTDTATYKSAVTSGQGEKIIGIFFLIFLILERWIAFKRNQ